MTPKSGGTTMDTKKELSYLEYVQHETTFVRAPYDPEREYYMLIQSGDVKTVEQLCKSSLKDTPGLGRLSDDDLKNTLYHFIVGTALVSRYCIEGGMDHSVAYNLSDYYIQRADHMKTMEEISDLNNQMRLDYTKRMNALGKRKVCSKPIVLCIDYIYNNLHTRITVNALASYVNLNPNYLSRLFKKETSLSISQYIMKKKIETAQNMLTYTNRAISDISSTLAFPSQSYFSCCFAKETGLTPSAYRSTHQLKTRI